MAYPCCARYSRNNSSLGFNFANKRSSNCFSLTGSEKEMDTLISPCSVTMHCAFKSSKYIATECPRGTTVFTNPRILDFDKYGIFLPSTLFSFAYRRISFSWPSPGLYFTNGVSTEAWYILNNTSVGILREYI